MMVTTAEFPQADRLTQVGKVAEAIAKGHHTDDAIEKYIGLDSDGRQGRYYRQAAVVLGLTTNHQNYSALTAAGQAYAAIATGPAQLDFLAQRLVDTPVFHQALQYILKNSPNQAQLKAWFRNFYPGEISTADRRFSTFMNYLRDASLVDIAKGVYVLSKYSGSVLKTSGGVSPAGGGKPLLPASPPAAPPAANGGGVIQVDVDLQKLERANAIHWKLVDAKSTFVSALGVTPYDNVHIDLFAEKDHELIIYEMKSVNDESTNLLSQVRKAVSQLYEYRFIYAKPKAQLCIVTNQGISKANRWLLDYLEKDRSIAYEWTDDFKNFQSLAQSKVITGKFAS